MAGFAVLGADVALAGFLHAHVGVFDATARSRVEGGQRYAFHRGVINPPSFSCSLEVVLGKRVE